MAARAELAALKCGCIISLHLAIIVLWWLGECKRATFWQSQLVMSMDALSPDDGDSQTILVHIDLLLQ